MSCAHLNAKLIVLLMIVCWALSGWYGFVLLVRVVVRKKDCEGVTHGQVRAFQRLRALCEEVLEALPTSVLEDRRQLAEVEAEIKEGTLHRRCLALSWRLKYKLCVASEILDLRAAHDTVS